MYAYNPEAEYYLWKTWWYMAAYRASPQMRMACLDDRRSTLGTKWRIPE